MYANKTQIIFLTNLDYVNPLYHELLREDEYFFHYLLTEDICTANFLGETQHNVFDRESYNIDYLLSNVPLSKFKDFFKSLSIDTPESLNKTKSLKRIKGLTPLTRFSLYLARSGKKNKLSTILLNSFFHLIDFLKTTNVYNIQISN